MKGFEMMKKLLVGGEMIDSTLANIGLLVLRVFMGLSMALAHGLGKVPPSERFIEGTATLGFPLPEFFAWAAGFSECFGGLFLAVGLFTRPSAFFLCSTMFVAAFIRHGADPFSGKEKALLFFFISLAFLLIGAGKYGVDTWLRSRK
jgi:putative oxidoreductase